MPAPFVFYAMVLNFETILHFSSMSLTGAVSNTSHFPFSVSVSHSFCTAHHFCHSSIQTLLVLCPISKDILALIINTLFLCLRSCWKREFLGQHQKRGRKYVSSVLGGGITGCRPKAQYMEHGTAPHHLFHWGFVLKWCPVCKMRAAGSDCSGREWDTEATVGTSK